MSTLGKKRISAKEAAEFLGVPYENISRIDKLGEYIKRYKLGHKTYVYDLESLEAFLEARRVEPIAPPGPARVTPVRGGGGGSVHREPQLSLQEFLRGKREERDKKK